MDIPPLPPANTGFDGEMYLTDAEHATYLRRMPVRYVAAALTRSGAPRRCSVCDQHIDGAKLQASHLIPFGEGVRRWKLTPEWLDRADNLRWAHQASCNKKVELSPEQVAEELRLYPPRRPG